MSTQCPGTSFARDLFYQAFPRVRPASDKCWGEKAWVRGYSYCIRQWLAEEQMFEHVGSKAHLNCYEIQSSSTTSVTVCVRYSVSEAVYNRTIIDDVFWAV